MSIMGRRVSVRTVAILALCMVVAGLIPAMTREPARENSR